MSRPRRRLNSISLYRLKEDYSITDYSNAFRCYCGLRELSVAAAAESCGQAQQRKSGGRETHCRASRLDSKETAWANKLEILQDTCDRATVSMHRLIFEPQRNQATGVRAAKH